MGMPSLDLFKDWMGWMLHRRSGDLFNAMGRTLSATFNQRHPGGSPKKIQSADMFVPLLSAILEGGLSISQAAQKIADAEEAFNDLVDFGTYAVNFDLAGMQNVLQWVIMGGGSPLPPALVFPFLILSIINRINNGQLRVAEMDIIKET